MTQPLQTTLARKWKVDVNTGTVSVPVWTAVRGLNEVTPSPFTPNLEDDNEYDQGGWTSQTKTALSWSIELKLLRKTDPADATSYDAGQEKLRDQARIFGGLGVANIRWYDRDGGPEAYTGFAEIEWVPDGGSLTDLETVTVTLHGKGEAEEIANPDTAVLGVPTVTSVTPSTGLAAAGGAMVKITGTNFTDVNGTAVIIGAAGMKVTGTNFTEYVVESRTVIWGRVPAKAAGAYNVTATSTAGTSATGAGNAVTYV
jgi:hypothetical protein